MFIINTVFQWYGSDCGSRKYQYLPQGLLFGLYPLPPGISSLASYFPFKNVAIETYHPLGIPNDHSWYGYGYSLDPHTRNYLNVRSVAFQL